jgi:DNA-binding transcriptional regulator YiaG/mRNA-degrading endonuclease RelE of RelBE toxin-antitoxin system
MEFEVRIKKKVARALEKLPEDVQRLPFLLIADLASDGPIQKSWRNFSFLGKNRYHCHLNYRYVARWTCRRNEIVIEVYVVVLSQDAGDERVPIEDTAYYAEMEKNRIGHLLAGARLKAGLTQRQLAAKLGIRQNMVSDYERGRRRYSDAIAACLSEVLQVKEAYLRYGDQPVDE